MMYETQTQHERAQTEAQQVYARMLEMLLGFEPAQSLTIGNVKFIAEWARTITYTALIRAETGTGKGTP